MNLEGNVRPDAVCDGGDLDCGSGLLLIIREAMAPLPPGGLLEVRSREISVKEDLPAWCRLVGHTLVAMQPGEGAYTHYFVRKHFADEALKADLEKARAFTWSARLRWTEGMQAKAFVRNHAFNVGQPASFDTQDMAPSAIEYLLATFMCAALAASASPEDELGCAVELVNRVVDGVDGPVLALHVCRGNWSQKEEVLLQGSYEALMPYFRRMRLEQFVLEYATPRAGPLEALKELPPHAHIGFGVVNPRTAELEPPEAIVARVKRLAELTAPERIFLNPDCGFGTFADRPVGTPEMAFKKLCALSRAAAILRENPSGKGPLTA